MINEQNSTKWIDDKLYQTIDQLGEITVNEQRDTYLSKLESFESYKERKKDGFKKEFKHLFSQYKTAFHVIIDHLIKGNVGNIKLTTQEKETILNELKKGQENLVKTLEIEQHKTFQEILGYSSTSLEKFYQVALNCFTDNTFTHAAAVFNFLVLLNPRIHNYWLGLAMSKQALGLWKEAIQYYSVAEKTDTTDPIPHLYASECHLELSDSANALECIDKAILCASDHTEDEFIEFKRTAMERKEMLLKTA